MLGWIVVGILAVHGLIHLMGVAKAFGLADLPQLTQPISRGWGLAWLLAAALVLASAVALAVGARRFWILGAAALVVSQVVVVSSWRDAWAGTIANVLLLVVAAHGWLTEGPRSFHAEFLRDSAAALSRRVETPPVTEADLAPLPPPVQRYLRLTGVVGQPRVWNYRLRFRGRIRSGPDSRWMPFEAEQQSVAGPHTRLFFMRARMFGLPVEAWHRLADGHATMRVRLAGVVTVVDARGVEMDRAETVTLLNDMCLLAPGTLLDPAIRWEAVDDRTVRAAFTNGAHTIAATLTFRDDGYLADFVSDDRLQASPDGRTFRPLRFSTPIREYRTFGPVTVAGFGEGKWHPPEGAFAYGEFAIVDAAMNVAR